VNRAERTARPPRAIAHDQFDVAWRLPRSDDRRERTERAQGFPRRFRIDLRGIVAFLISVDLASRVEAAERWHD
jgi:hypothetical protein